MMCGQPSSTSVQVQCVTLTCDVPCSVELIMLVHADIIRLPGQYMLLHSRAQFAVHHLLRSWLNRVCKQ